MSDEFISNFKRTNPVQIVKSLRNIEFISEDFFFAYVFKKTQRIVSVLYIMTDFVSDNDPLKAKVRQLALELLSCGVSFMHSPSSQIKEKLNSIAEVSAHTVAILEVGLITGFFSEMNTKILTGELENLINKIQSKFGVHAGSTVEFSLEDLEVEIHPESQAAKKKTRKTSVYKNEGEPVLDKQRGTTGENRKPAIKNMGNSEMGDTKDLKDSRAKFIRDILTEKADLTIREIGKFMPDLGEKTLQRELIRMVRDGVLYKKGERRWSRYGVAKVASL